MCNNKTTEQPGAAVRAGQRRPPVESGGGGGDGGGGADMEYEAEFVCGVMVRHDPSHLRLAALRSVCCFILMSWTRFSWDCASWLD